MPDLFRIRRSIHSQSAMRLQFNRPIPDPRPRRTLASMPFAILHLPEPRLLRLVGREDDAFGAEIAFAFAPFPAAMTRLTDRGFTIVQTKGVDVQALDDDPMFRLAVICLLRREGQRPEPEGLQPPGVKKKERDRRG